MHRQYRPALVVLVATSLDFRLSRRVRQSFSPGNVADRGASDLCDTELHKEFCTLPHKEAEATTQGGEVMAGIKVSLELSLV